MIRVAFVGARLLLNYYPTTIRVDILKGQVYCQFFTLKDYNFLSFEIIVLQHFYRDTKKRIFFQPRAYMGNR